MTITIESFVHTIDVNITDERGKVVLILNGVTSKSGIEAINSTLKATLLKE